MNSGFVKVALSGLFTLSTTYSLENNSEDTFNYNHNASTKFNYGQEEEASTNIEHNTTTKTHDHTLASNNGFQKHRLIPKYKDKDEADDNWEEEAENALQFVENELELRTKRNFTDESH